MDCGNRLFEYHFSKNIACFCYFDLIKFILRTVWLIFVNYRRICLNWIVSLYTLLSVLKIHEVFFDFSFYLILVERFTSIHIYFCHEIRFFISLNDVLKAFFSF